MKLSILQEDLNYGASLASRFVSSRAQIPILGNILIRATGGKLVLEATNLESGIHIPLGAKIEEEGELTVPARILVELTSTLPAGRVEILKDKGINVEIFDPFIQSISTVKNLEEILKQCKAIILCTAHKSFVTNLTSEKLTEYKTKILIDGRNCLDSKSLSQAGIYYKGIGF